MPCRQSEKEHGHDLHQPHQAKGEGRVGALIELPADGDGEHLLPQRPKEAGEGEEAEVAQAQHRVGVVWLGGAGRGGWRSLLVNGTHARSLPPWIPLTYPSCRRAALACVPTAILLGPPMPAIPSDKIAYVLKQLRHQQGRQNPIPQRFLRPAPGGEQFIIATAVRATASTHTIAVAVVHAP